MEIIPDYAKKRLSICRACKDYNQTIKTCNHCGCFMPGKTLLKGASCPLGKWGSIHDDSTSKGADV